MNAAAPVFQMLDLRGPVGVYIHLPPEIKRFTYVRNHHYIELTDAHGHTLRLVAKSLIKGVCRSCSHEVLVESRIGDMACPHCRGPMEWVWGKAQLHFAPETEATFTSGPSSGPPGPPK